MTLASVAPAVEPAGPSPSKTGRRLAGFAMAYGASAALQKGLGFVLFLWLAHSLSVQAYATFGLLFALQAGVATLAAAGVVEAVVGLLKDRPSKQERDGLFNSANAVFGIVALVTIALVAAASGPLTRHAHATAADLAFVALAGALTAFYALQSQLTRLDEAHGASVSLGFFPPLAGLLGGFAGFLVGRDVSAFIAGMALGMLACLPPFVLARIGFYRFGRKPTDALPILERLAPFVLIAVLGWLSGYGNTYLVQSFFSATDVARFTFAYTLSSIMQLVATALNQVWSPRMFRLIHELPVEEVERRNRRFFFLQGAVLGAVGAIVLVLSPVAVRVGGGSLLAYRGLTDELFFLLAAYVLAIPWYHAQNFYYAHGKGRALMNATIATSAAGVLLWILAASVLGTLGAYVGFMLMFAVRSLATWFGARREWRIGIPWQGPAVGLAVMLPAAWLARSIFPAAP